MKTTILFWGRAEGKTKEIIDRLHDHRINSRNKLLLTHDNKEIDRLKREYRFPPNTTVMSFGSLSNRKARGLIPDLIFIDNAEFLDEHTYKQELLPLAMSAKEMIITSSERGVFKLFQTVKDEDFINFTKSVVNGWVQGLHTAEHAMSYINSKHMELYQ